MSESKVERMERLEREVVAICERCRGLLPDARLDDSISLARHVEWGIALENLCSNLGDEAAQVDDVTLQAIERAGTEMGLDPEYWRTLRRRP